MQYPLITYTMVVWYICDASLINKIMTLFFAFIHSYAFLILHQLITIRIRQRTLKKKRLSLRVLTGEFIGVSYSAFYLASLFLNLLSGFLIFVSSLLWFSSVLVSKPWWWQGVTAPEYASSNLNKVNWKTQTPCSRGSPPAAWWDHQHCLKILISLSREEAWASTFLKRPKTSSGAAKAENHSCLELFKKCIFLRPHSRPINENVVGGLLASLDLKPPEHSCQLLASLSALGTDHLSGPV